MRISLDETNTLPDIISVDAFEMLFTSIPGGGNANLMRLKCQQVNIPGVQINPVTVRIFGFTRQFPTPVKFDDGIDCTFFEDRNFATLKALHSWLFYCSSFAKGDAAARSVYAVSATLNIFDGTGAIAQTIPYSEVWPMTINSISLSSESGAQALMISARFAYSNYTPPSN